MSKVFFDHKSDLEYPPVSFVHDLRSVCASLADVQRACGVGQDTAKKLLDMQPVRRHTLEVASRTFYGGFGESVLRTQMSASMRKDGMGHATMLRLLRAMARFVDQYMDDLYVSKQCRRYWIFPPRDTIRRLTEVHKECFDLLKRIVRECPEYCDDIFSDAPGLLEKLSGKAVKKPSAGDDKEAREKPTT